LVGSVKKQQKLNAVIKKISGKIDRENLERHMGKG
jgi:hypothetical protein